MNSTINVRPNDAGVKDIIEATFPSFNGRDVRVIVTEKVRFYGTQWDGGCRRQYEILRLSDKKTMPITEAPFLRHSDMHEADHTIAEGFVVVVLNTSGRRDSIEILTPPTGIVAQLTKQVELPEDERRVLVLTRSLKSSYGGISNYRQHEAKRKYGMTPADYDAAKARLIEKKLLNKAGAITVEGRNAVQGQWE